MTKQVIVITGASSGMGKETAISLIKQGHIIYALARRIELMNDIEQIGGFPMKVDVTEANEIKSCIDYIIQKEGKIDVLWNNAGYGLFGAVEDVPIEEAKRQFEVNLFGLSFLTQQVIPHMRKAKSGKIINTSSVGGKIYTPLGAWYHATKHALEGYSDCLRFELKPFNIHVVLVEPGLIRTEWSDTMLEQVKQFSSHGAYTELTEKVAKSTEKIYGVERKSANPRVISRTIQKIVNSKKPKTRYRVGYLAKPIVWARIYLGDRLFDFILRKQL